MAFPSALPTAHDNRPGEVIAGRYRLQRKLGEGGMGVVWIARSTALDVDVALKILRRELAGTHAVERMAREAHTAAQLGHPAILRVFDCGTSERGDPYLAMELLEGEDLDKRREREKRIDAATAVGLILPIIDGLGTAHEKGIVHRDIKPENIFIADDAHGRVQPKLLDFGIAKLGHEHAPSRLTQMGAIMGSPYYLSPEQAEGLDDIDFRCDIWSVGVVLYELITGVRPFEAANYNALIHGILHDTPQPTTAHLAGDAQLWLIICQCLRKEREKRWGSMWELGEALALWLFERGVRVDAASRSLRHGWLDGTVTGVRILVNSNAPDASALEAEVPTIPASATRLPVQITATTTVAAGTDRSRSGLKWGAGVGLAAAAMAVMFYNLHTPAPPRGVRSGAELRPAAAVTLHVVAPPALVSDPSSVGLVPPSADTRPPPPAAASQVRVEPRNDQPRPKVNTRSGSAPVTKRPKASQEFGF